MQTRPTAGRRADRLETLRFIRGRLPARARRRRAGWERRKPSGVAWSEKHVMSWLPLFFFFFNLGKKKKKKRKKITYPWII